MKTLEINFDGLIGPTHNFSGLATGNLAATKSKFKTSHPKKAALEGLAKIRLLHQLGLRQGFVPPQERPDFITLRQLGFIGNEKAILENVGRGNENLLARVYSSSFMWTANAATVSPSADTKDRKIHITPANLATLPHRALEAPATARVLKEIFFDQKIFQHHPALPTDAVHFDEGAANHLRMCAEYAGPGIEIFVYGKSAVSGVRPRKFVSRQSLEASQVNVKKHKLRQEQVICVQQNPKVIDEGVFHNDVIAMNNQSFLIFHEDAFVGKAGFLKELQAKFSKFTGRSCLIEEISKKRLSVKEAVKTYFFNSQLVSLSNGRMVMLSPQECFESAPARSLIEEIVQKDNPVQKVMAIDLRESMLNGGGPACLRLRVVVNEKELSGIRENYLLNEKKIRQLENWIRKHFREQLSFADLRDEQLLKETRTALDELTELFGLGNIYDFQI